MNINELVAELNHMSTEEILPGIRNPNCKDYGFRGYGSFSPQGSRRNLGMDIIIGRPETILAPFEGTIQETGFDSREDGFGNYMIVKHEFRDVEWHSFLGNLSSNFPWLGYVERGQKMALSEGGILHYQLSADLIDPSNLPDRYCSKEEFENRRVISLNPNLILKIPGLD